MHHSKTNIVLSISLLLLCHSAVQAQFNQILKRTGQKLEREIERRAVEKASDIIAREIANTMEREFDEWLTEAAEKDTSFHYEEGDSAAYRMGRAYGDFLRGMNESADLPESYHFDAGLLVELESEGEKPEKMWIYLSKSEPIFAMKTSAEEDQSQIILMDSDRDVMVMYRESADGKTAQAISSFTGMLSPEDLDMGEYHFEATGKKEKVAGYQCKGYKGWNDEYVFEFFTTDALGLSWSESFGPIMRKFGGDDYMSRLDEVEGICMKSISWEKGKEKKTTRWETLEVAEEGLEILNADYNFGYTSK